MEGVGGGEGGGCFKSLDIAGSWRRGRYSLLNTGKYVHIGGIHGLEVKIGGCG